MNAVGVLADTNFHILGCNTVTAHHNVCRHVHGRTLVLTSWLIFDN